MSLISWITLEPVTFLFTFGMSILGGAQVDTDLLLNKICVTELNHDIEKCSNFTYIEDVNTEVQREANNFYMVAGWITRGFALFYSLFAGSLADDFGYKPMILAPVFSMVICDIILLFNSMFINHFPIEIFYLGDGWAFLGGNSVYLLGVYGYGTKISDPDSRATTLARYDGFEVLGRLAGTYFSPMVKNHFGAPFNYGLKIICLVLVLVYVTFLVRESSEKKPSLPSCQNVLEWFKPLVDMFKAMTKVRPNLNLILAIQYFLFAIYAFSFEEEGMRYLYLQKAFEGFDGTDFAHLTMFITAVNTIGLLVILPILSHKVNLHESTIQTMAIFVEVIGLYAFTFSNTIWQVYISNFFIEILSFTKWGLMRALISKCVEMHETGKMFSALAIGFALFPLAGGPAYRQLYNYTLEYFPASEILLKASLYTMLFKLSLYVWWKKNRIENWKKSNENQITEL